jgi:hypothetical protein
VVAARGTASARAACYYEPALRCNWHFQLVLQAVDAALVLELALRQHERSELQQLLKGYNCSGLVRKCLKVWYMLSILQRQRVPVQPVRGLCNGSLEVSIAISAPAIELSMLIGLQDWLIRCSTKTLLPPAAAL